MKKLLLANFVGLAVALLALFLVGGCKATPARVGYNIVSGSQATAEHAMTAWGDYVAQFHPPVAQERLVLAAYKRFQAAQTAAEDAAETAAQLLATAPTNGPPVAALFTQQNAAAVSKALADLLDILRASGLKI